MARRNKLLAALQPLEKLIDSDFLITGLRRSSAKFLEVMGMTLDPTTTNNKKKKSGGKKFRCIHQKRENQLLRDMSLHPVSDNTVYVLFDRIDDTIPKERRMVRDPRCDFCCLVKHDAPRPCFHMRDYVCFMMYAMDVNTPPKRIESLMSFHLD